MGTQPTRLLLPPTASILLEGIVALAHHSRDLQCPRTNTAAANAVRNSRRSSRSPMIRPRNAPAVALDRRRTWPRSSVRSASLSRAPVSTRTTTDRRSHRRAAARNPPTRPIQAPDLLAIRRSRRPRPRLHPHRHPTSRVGGAPPPQRRPRERRRSCRHRQPLRQP